VEPRKNYIKYDCLKVTTDLLTLFYHERRLRGFFNDLGTHGIFSTEDLEKHSEDEIFSIAPTSKRNKNRIMAYVDAGFLSLRHN